MKTLIVDDEPIARRVLREELELFPQVQIMGEAEDGRQALQQIAELQPDLVFLDLQMPVMGGFEVVRNLKGGRLPVIVIVTAFDQHAIEAFEAGAMDYLLKPVNESRLRKAVERAARLARQAASGGRAPGQYRLQRTRKAARSWAGAAKSICSWMPTKCSPSRPKGELVWIITAKRRLLASHSLRALEARLGPSPFHRVHRNAIVNVNHVRKMSALSSQRWLLTLSNQQQLL